MFAISKGSKDEMELPLDEQSFNSFLRFLREVVGKNTTMSVFNQPAAVLPDRNNSSWLGVLEKVESVFWGGGGHDWES